MERILYWFVYAFTAAQAVRRRRDSAPHLWAARFPILMVLVAFMSTTWSIAPVASLRAAFSLGMVMLFGVYLGSRFRPSALLGPLAAVFSVAALASVAFALLLPSYGIGRGAFEGDWQGVFTTKNVLGLTMLVTIMVLRSARAGSTALRRVAGCGMAAATGALILSGSVASLIVLLVVTVTMPLLSLVRRSHNRKALALACADVAVAALGS